MQSTHLQHMATCSTFGASRSTSMAPTDLQIHPSHPIFEEKRCMLRALWLELHM